MTVYRKGPNQSFRPVWDERTQELHLRETAESKNRAGYMIAVLMLLALAVMCVVGFLVVRLLARSTSPAILPRFETWTPSATAVASETPPTSMPTTPVPGDALLNISPQQGYINTLITVSGQGWWPGEPVFVFLRSEEEGDGRGYSYAAAVADDQGNMHTALTFPNEMRWIGQDWADVIARGSRSGREARSRFTLLVPTATATPLPPTARPTRPPTDTPAPTSTPLPSNTPLPTFTPTPELVITDWRGEYYANLTVSGDPVLIRNEPSITFNWGNSSPGPQVPVDQFSARWTRRIRFDEGSYRFVVAADDGVRLWIDGQLVIDQWHDGSLIPYSVDIYVPKGRHALQLEYYENQGGAAVEFSWSPVPQATATPTPTSPPPPPPAPSEAWHGEYFDNPNLAGQPVLAREDDEINFDWGFGSPGGAIPPDQFSVRWTRDYWFAAQTYRFVVRVDDGVRFWVDGELLIDEWHISAGERYRADVYLPEGAHHLRIEYFEFDGGALISFKSKGPAESGGDS